MPGVVDAEAGASTATSIVLVSGARYEVDGSPTDVEATIVAASRGSILQLAWVTETGSGRALAINPQHVAALEPA